MSKLLETFVSVILVWNRITLILVYFSLCLHLRLYLDLCLDNIKIIRLTFCKNILQPSHLCLSDKYHISTFSVIGTRNEDNRHFYIKLWLKCPKNNVWILYMLNLTFEYFSPVYPGRSIIKCWFSKRTRIKGTDITLTYIQ